MFFINPGGFQKRPDDGNGMKWGCFRMHVSLPHRVLLRERSALSFVILSHLCVGVI